MPLQILTTPPEQTAAELRRAIEEALADAEVEVRAAGGGHFEVRVVSAAFAGLSRVQQQQRVYAAIAPFMKGDSAPVHAIDRLQTLLPD